MRNGAATIIKCFPEARSAFWIGKTIVIAQDYVNGNGWNAFTPTTDDGQIGLTIQAIAERCGVAIPVAAINDVVQGGV